MCCSLEQIRRGFDACEVGQLVLAPSLKLARLGDQVQIKPLPLAAKLWGWSQGAETPTGQEK